VNEAPAIFAGVVSGGRYCIELQCDKINLTEDPMCFYCHEGDITTILNHKFVKSIGD